MTVNNTTPSSVLRGTSSAPTAPSGSLKELLAQVGAPGSGSASLEQNAITTPLSRNFRDSTPRSEAEQLRLSDIVASQRHFGSLSTEEIQLFTQQELMAWLERRGTEIHAGALKDLKSFIVFEDRPGAMGRPPPRAYFFYH